LVLIEDKVIYQGWLRRKIAQKCLEILLLLYIFASDQRKEESNTILGGAGLSNFRYKKQLLTFFEQPFEKLRATFWEISSNLCKALPVCT